MRYLMSSAAPQSRLKHKSRTFLGETFRDLSRKKYYIFFIRSFFFVSQLNFKNFPVSDITILVFFSTDFKNNYFTFIFFNGT